MFGNETTLSEFNPFLRKFGFRLRKLNSPDRWLLQEATLKHKNKLMFWVDRKIFYDLEDVILFSNHLLLGTEDYAKKLTTRS